MAKSSKLSKEELKGPDSFVTISDHIFHYVEKHFGMAVSVIGVILLAAVAKVGLNYLNVAHEKKAAEAIYQAEAGLHKAEESMSESKTQRSTDSAKGADKNADTGTKKADYVKDYAPLVQNVKQQLQAHADTKAALVSALSLSEFLLQQKQYEEALAVLNLITYKPQTADLLNGFWQMHRGLVLIENKQLDPALQAYQSILASAGLKAFHPEAMLKLGLCFELKGDQGKARETYERLQREFPNSDASATGQQYIRLLDLQKPASTAAKEG